MIAQPGANAVHSRNHKQRLRFRRAKFRGTLVESSIKRRSERPWRLGVLSWAIFTAISLILLFPVIQTSSWKSTVAIIVKTSVEVYPFNDYEGTQSRSHTILEYSYEVDGKSYGGKGTYAIGTTKGAYLRANEIWIIYDPGKPWVSKVSDDFLKVVGIFFAISGTALLAIALVDSLIAAIRERGSGKRRLSSSVKCNDS